MRPLPIIAVDIDDVLADHASGFTAFSNERYGTNLQPSDYDEHFGKLWGVDIEEVKRRFAEYLDEKIYTQYAPDALALDVLRRLSERFHCVVLTSRPTSAREDTLAWMADHYPDVFDDGAVHFAGIWDDIKDSSLQLTKGDMVRQIGASYLIDDQVKHCNAAAEVGVVPLLFGNYKWNTGLESASQVTRVANWAEVEEFFEHVH